MCRPGHRPLTDCPPDCCDESYGAVVRAVRVLAAVIAIGLLTVTAVASVATYRSAHRTECYQRTAAYQGFYGTDRFKPLVEQATGKDPATVTGQAESQVLLDAVWPGRCQ